MNNEIILIGFILSLVLLFPHRIKTFFLKPTLSIVEFILVVLILLYITSI